MSYFLSRKSAAFGGNRVGRLWNFKAFIAHALLLMLLACGTAAISRALADDTLAQSAFPPPAGKGHVVILISGGDGPGRYESFAADVAKLGYYAVLLDARDIWGSGSGAAGINLTAEDQKGSERLKAAILRAQQSSSAAPGKVAVIGFSRGGGVALFLAAPLRDLVSGIVAYYPNTGRIAHDADYKTFVDRFIKVPVLMLAGEQDNFYDCCLIDTARKLETAAKAANAPLDLVVYPNANHLFNFKRPEDGADAWQRTTAKLRQYLGE